jgi:hypothetical protein
MVHHFSAILYPDWEAKMPRPSPGSLTGPEPGLTPDTKRRKPQKTAISPRTGTRTGPKPGPVVRFVGGYTVPPNPDWTDYRAICEEVL